MALLPSQVNHSHDSKEIQAEQRNEDRPCLKGGRQNKGVRKVRQEILQYKGLTWNSKKRKHFLLKPRIRKCFQKQNYRKDCTSAIREGHKEKGRPLRF